MLSITFAGTGTIAGVLPFRGGTTVRALTKQLEKQPAPRPWRARAAKICVPHTLAAEPDLSTPFSWDGVRLSGPRGDLRAAHTLERSGFGRGKEASATAHCSPPPTDPRHQTTLTALAAARRPAQLGTAEAQTPETPDTPKTPETSAFGWAVSGDAAGHVRLWCLSKERNICLGQLLMPALALELAPGDIWTQTDGEQGGDQGDDQGDDQGGDQDASDDARNVDVDEKKAARAASAATNEGDEKIKGVAGVFGEWVAAITHTCLCIWRRQDEHQPFVPVLLRRAAAGRQFERLEATTSVKGGGLIMAYSSRPVKNATLPLIPTVQAGSAAALYGPRTLGMRLWRHGVQLVRAGDGGTVYDVCDGLVEDFVSALAVDDRAGRVFVSASDNQLHILQLQTGSRLASVCLYCPIETLCLSPDGALLVTGHPDYARVWTVTALLTFTAGRAPRPAFLRLQPDAHMHVPADSVCCAFKNARTLRVWTVGGCPVQIGGWDVRGPVVLTKEEEDEEGEPGKEDNKAALATLVRAPRLVPQPHSWSAHTVFVPGPNVLVYGPILLCNP
jgi:hypothetical protein